MSSGQWDDLFILVLLAIIFLATLGLITNFKKAYKAHGGYVIMGTEKPLKQPWKAIRGFFAFWKDFLVGDSPVLALGVIIILAIAYLFA